jgi:predicted HTH transcriptional regulator
MLPYEESAQVELKQEVNADFKKEVVAFANGDGGAFDKSRSANQELTFAYAEDYFNRSNVGFGDNNKRTLGLMDSDGYYTNAALLLSDQCAHSVKCAVYDGTGKQL